MPAEITSIDHSTTSFTALADEPKESNLGDHGVSNWSKIEKWAAENKNDIILAIIAISMVLGVIGCVLLAVVPITTFSITVCVILISPLCLVSLIGRFLIEDVY